MKTTQLVQRFLYVLLTQFSPWTDVATFSRSVRAEFETWDPRLDRVVETFHSTATTAIELTSSSSAFLLQISRTTLESLISRWEQVLLQLDASVDQYLPPVEPVPDATTGLRRSKRLQGLDRYASSIPVQPEIPQSPISESPQPESFLSVSKSPESQDLSPSFSQHPTLHGSSAEFSPPINRDDTVFASQTDDCVFAMEIPFPQHQRRRPLRAQPEVSVATAQTRRRLIDCSSDEEDDDLEQIKRHVPPAKQFSEQHFDLTMRTLLTQAGLNPSSAGAPQLLLPLPTSAPAPTARSIVSKVTNRLTDHLTSHLSRFSSPLSFW